jgi:ABC-2 type transport system ATP-binding protein
MKSKLMLSIALAHNSRFLILDEPTSGLDPIVRDDILMLIKDYVKDHNASVLFSTHVTSDLDKIADEVVFLHKGKLVFHKSIGRLRNEYLLVRFKEEYFSRVSKKGIISTIKRDGIYSALVDAEKADISTISTFGQISTPNIDDIMLFYIKGEAEYDWLN